MVDADPRMKGLEAKLNALVRCVLDHAKENKAFADEMHQIFLTDTVPAGKAKGGKAKADKEVFDPVTFLQTHGQEKLRGELNGKPASELSDIVRVRGVVKGRAAKSLERDEMIAKIVEYAQKKLHQGITIAGDSGLQEDEGNEKNFGRGGANGEQRTTSGDQPTGSATDSVVAKQ